MDINRDGPFVITESQRQIIDAQQETSSKMQQLISDDIMGENSFILHTVTDNYEYAARQESESVHDLWQSLMTEGADGEQTAKFLEEMVTERRDIIDGYLRGYYELSFELSLELDIDNLQEIDLDKIIENISQGRSAAENSDGSVLPQADVVNEFGQKNNQALIDSKDTYQEIQKLPKHLSQWLDENNIDRPLAVDVLAEKYRYSYLNGRAEQSDEILAISDNFSGYSSRNRGLVDFSDIYLDPRIVKHLGDSKYTALQMASILKREDERLALQEYTRVYEPVANDFNEKVASQLEPRFTLQDIIDNLAEGRNATAIKDGDSYSPHPQSVLITRFVEVNVIELIRIKNKQADLNNPSTVNEWMEKDYNADRAYAKAEEVYGIARWETGELSRSSRGYPRYSQDSFREDSTYYISADSRIKNDEWKALITEEAVALEEELNTLLNDVQGFSLGEPFTLEQLITNFKQGDRLGKMANGEMHPNASQIESAFASQKLKIADYIDSQWLRDGTPAEPDNTKEGAQTFIDSLMQMITASKEVWTFDQLLGIDDAVTDAKDKKLV